MAGRQQGTLDGWMSGRGSHRGSSRGSHRGSGRGGSSRGRGGRSEGSERPLSARRMQLAAVAADTRTVLPTILAKLPNLHASKAEVFMLETLPALKAEDCPKRPPTPIKVVNQDSFNAAIALAATKGPASGRVAVLNMASHRNPGGGWLRGAVAQEEMLCYRSSLALSLHQRYYPWRQRMGIYTPDVLIIRSDMPSGHKLLMPDVPAEDLPVVSALSIAALCRPETRRLQTRRADGTTVERQIYADDAARDLTKDKMRLCLRMAAHRGHGSLVLGALGCGAFLNPREEVTQCWLEVFGEAEFAGGWWEDVVFAVYDARNEGNFDVFERDLGGVLV